MGSENCLKSLSPIGLSRGIGRREGFPLPAYFIPGRDGDEAWPDSRVVGTSSESDKKSVVIYINRVKGPGAVSGKPHSPMASARPRARFLKYVRKWAGPKEGLSEIFLSPGIPNEVSGRSFWYPFQRKVKQ